MRTTAALAVMLGVGLAVCLPACAARPGPTALPEARDVTVETIASAGANPAAKGPGKVAVFAQALEAEVRNNARSNGLRHNEATMLVVAGDLLPGAHQQAGTRSGGAASAGGPPDGAIDAFGPVAVAVTDAGVHAVAGSRAMPAKSEGASGSTTRVWDPETLRRGTGASRLAFTNSVAVTHGAPQSAGISNIGGGPMAVAAAGEAVAVSRADTPANGMNGFSRR